MKDLIIINSYTPDYEREELLRSFVKQIDKPYHWGLFSLAKYEEINSLLIIKDHKEITRYNFEEINKEDYKSRNTFRPNN